ncbi:MAG: Tol-Pal system beta propeller repeat protein TolB [Candidatus Aminicenantes bacterium]|nr:Tol-Pal system beta propeller repeat protein TolB [Candidatus Aminicenantes bacterium]
MKKNIIILGILCTLLFPGKTPSQQEFYLRITEGMPAIPIALPQFSFQSGSPEFQKETAELHDIIKNDLKYSRIFQPLPENYYSYIRPINPNKILFKDWQSISAHLLLVGEVSPLSGGDILFEGKIYDVKSERFIKGRRYQSEKSLVRLMAHRMSNELMKMYGEPPLFTSKIAFVSNRDGNDEIYLMDYDGQNQTRLTFNKVQDYMPALSPDGRKIAYTSYRSGKAALYVLDIYEGKITEIKTEGRTNYAPCFSPDGKVIVFCSHIPGGNPEIFTASTNGNNVKRVTFNNAADTAPYWSPTARQIAFTSDRSGTPQIYIMDAEGSNVRRVSFGGNYHDGPAWSPSGDRIAYIARVDQIFDIYILNIRTNRVTKLTESSARNESPTWSPDGRHIVFSSNRTGTIQIYSMDYDGSNVRQLTHRGENKLPFWSIVQ